VGVTVAVGVGVLGRAVGSPVRVGVGVLLGVAVGDGEGDGVAVALGLGVTVGVAVEGRCTTRLLADGMGESGVAMSNPTVGEGAALPTGSARMAAADG